MSKNFVIGWLYPRLMSTYGDRGNIMVLQKRLAWRQIPVEVKPLDIGFTSEDLKKCNLLFMGGAQDRQQSIVTQDFTKEKVQQLAEMIESDTPGLFICGAYQFLGNYYKEADGTQIPGLGILDLYTENPGEQYPRLIGNIVTKYQIPDSKYNTLVGFENHGGRTFLGQSVQPFGTVLAGYGNNGTDKTEGAWYKNSFGTYLHGPVLPKNPHFADFLLQLALEKKYKQPVELPQLDDQLEWDAHKAILNRMKIAV